MTARWTARASRDLLRITRHIAAENPAAAWRLLGRIEDVAERVLPGMPGVGRPGRVDGTREYVVHANYILVYRPGRNGIDVIALRHVAQRWPAGF